MGSPLDESLAEWLRVRAGVHERILDKTLLALEEVEVFEVEDLVHLERLPDFALCFSAVTGSKVREALALRKAGTAAPVAPPPESSPASCFTIPNETEAGKSNTITTSPGDLIGVQPRSPAGKAVSFGGDSTAEIGANQLNKEERAARRGAREAAEQAARAEAKCPLASYAAADGAAIRIQAAVRRARVLAVASGPAAYFAPPVLPQLLEITLRARAWHGGASARPGFAPEQLAAAAEDRAEMVADLRARPGHLGAATRAAVDGLAEGAEARRRAKKNAKTKARRGRARAAKQADAEASASCAMAGETEVGTLTTTIIADPGNLPAAQPPQAPDARPRHHSRAALRWARIVGAALSGPARRSLARHLLHEVHWQWTDKVELWGPQRRDVYDGSGGGRWIRGLSEAAKLWDGFEWAPNPLFTGELPPDPGLRQHAGQQGRGDCESDDDDDYYGVYGNDDLYGATLGSEGGLGRMLQAEHEWG